MSYARLILPAAFTALSAAAPALAQDAEFKLPDQCIGPMGGMDHSAMGHGDASSEADREGMPAHVRENLRKMMVTMPAMQMGMSNEDPDIAFACGMIAHHQGAIDMAQVLLVHGDDAEMRALAEEIIAAQVAEIAQMTEWLSKNAGR